MCVTKVKIWHKLEGFAFKSANEVIYRPLFKKKKTLPGGLRHSALRADRLEYSTQRTGLSSAGQLSLCTAKKIFLTIVLCLWVNENGLYTYGYFVHLQDNLISFIGYFYSYVRLHLVSQTSTLFYFFLLLITGIFHSLCCNTPYCRCIWDMRTVLRLMTWCQDNQAARQTAYALSFFSVFLCMLSLLFWRIVDWTKSGIIDLFMGAVAYSRISHADWWYCICYI